ncbi:type VI secretion system tip protein VgrG, partial [Escherichia coli]
TGAFYARLRHERYLNGQTRLSGVTGSPAVAPGQVLTVTGGFAVPAAFARGVVIPATEREARRDRDFEVRFTGIPDGAETA